MKIAILAGGPVSLLPSLSKEDYDIWVGVDRGALELTKLGIKPDHAFGDFDSMTRQEREALPKKTKRHEFEPEKDYTDLELALDWAISEGPEEIVVYGATGGRLDHEWANFQLLQKGIGPGTRIELRDRQNVLTASGPGKYEVMKNETFPYISFLPLFESIKGLTLEGFKYALSEADVKAGSTKTVSNELIRKTGTYSLDAGIVLVIRSRDHL